MYTRVPITLGHGSSQALTARDIDTVSEKETTELRAVCDRYAQQGGEFADIARDIRQASDELDALAKSVRAFLAR